MRLPLRLRCVGGGRKGGVSFKAVSVEGRLTNRVKWLWLSEPPRRCLPFPPDLRRTHLSPLGRRPTSRLIYSSFRLVLSAPPRLYVTPAARPTSWIQERPLSHYYPSLSLSSLAPSRGPPQTGFSSRLKSTPRGPSAGFSSVSFPLDPGCDVSAAFDPGDVNALTSSEP